MQDIENKEDIETLVHYFYTKVQKDATIGFFFTKIVSVDWESHLPKMVGFWESILFGNANYKGNPMLVHFPINQLQAMEEKHFDQWIALWEESVQEKFSGPMADSAITKAKNIAKLMSYKMKIATEKAAI